jgi:hypothetical protein
MITRGIIFEDFVNYKLPCMTIESPYCNCFKCDQECGEPVCQNSELANSPLLEYSIDSIINAYKNNPITKAICFQGLEPFDTFEDLYDFIFVFRDCYLIQDDIVIYTGYKKYEIENQLEQLKHFSNIIVKFGRYIPQQPPVYDEILGVELASPNQYAERIS